MTWINILILWSKAFVGHAIFHSFLGTSFLSISWNPPKITTHRFIKTFFPVKKKFPKWFFLIKRSTTKKRNTQGWWTKWSITINLMPSALGCFKKTAALVVVRKKGNGSFIYESKQEFLKVYMFSVLIILWIIDHVFSG